MTRLRRGLALFGVLSLVTGAALNFLAPAAPAPWIYGGLGLLMLAVYAVLEWRHRQRTDSPAAEPVAGGSGRYSRRGAALALALVTLALIAVLAAAGGARAYGLNAERRRTDRQARLRIAVWDAVHARLSAAVGAVPRGARREAPDGVVTDVEVRRLVEKQKGDPPRYALACRAEYAQDRREAWSLAEQGLDGAFRILVWVER